MCPPFGNCQDDRIGYFDIILTLGLPIVPNLRIMLHQYADNTKRVCNKCHIKLSVREHPVTKALLVLAPPIPCLERLTSTCEECGNLPFIA